jgi:phosphatidylglycerophosphatase A
MAFAETPETETGLPIARPDPKRPLHLLATGFGSGLINPAPGTWGSLAAIPFILALHQLSLPVYLLVLAISAIAGIWLCGVVARDLGVDDHQAIVWDEFVGMGITLAIMPPGMTLPAVILGFLLFRLFDIVKPGPIGWLDKNLKGGAGIMMDDILAGIFALFSLVFTLGLYRWITVPSL